MKSKIIAQAKFNDYHQLHLHEPEIITNVQKWQGH